MSTWIVGDLEVARVVDIDVALPSEAPVPEWCVPWFAPSSREVRIAFSAFVVMGGPAPMVVDPWLANDAPRSEPDAGAVAQRLLAALEEAGAPAAEVSLVVNTHLDGIGWNTRPTREGRWVSSFPAARHVWPAANLAVHPDDDRLVPLRRDGVVDEVDLPCALAPGVELTAGPGHEEGHGVVWVRSGGEVACLSGHLFLSPLQVADPGLGLDADPAVAEATRRQLLATLAEEGGLLLSPLLGGPGGGRVRPDGQGWALIPD